MQGTKSAELIESGCTGYAPRSAAEAGRRYHNDSSVKHGKVRAACSDTATDRVPGVERDDTHDYRSLEILSQYHTFVDLVEVTTKVGHGRTR